ncbi:MAG: hypothetical protein GXX79_04235 [Actinomycetales bacterium]|nr:hypothetical protein [Actinomycetales bacterium]
MSPAFSDDGRLRDDLLSEPGSVDRRTPVSTEGGQVTAGVGDRMPRSDLPGHVYHARITRYRLVPHLL